MQLFVRDLQGRTRSLHCEPCLSDIQAAVQAATGVPAHCQVLSFQGRLLQHGGGVAMHAQGSVIGLLQQGSTLVLTSRLLGGKPTKVRIIAPQGDNDSSAAAACSPEVTIDVETDTPMAKVKMALWKATGVPIKHQHVMLAGMGDMVMIDRRSNIGVSYCGSANSMYFATLPATKAPGTSE